jgi:Ca-activated chloride channel family protein
MIDRTAVILRRAAVLLALFSFAAPPLLHAEAAVRITSKPEGVVHGELSVPVSTTADVVRVELLINNIHFSEAIGRSVVFPVHIGEYLRRMRFRALGYDAQGQVIGSDEMVINDPRPPFRAHLLGPATLPTSGNVPLSVSISKPTQTTISGVDFYVGEEKIATAAAPPYETSFDAARFASAVYARVVVRTAGGDEANDVLFFGTTPRDEVNVELQHIPISVASGRTPLLLQDLTLIDNGSPKKIEALVPASEEPLRVILLIDYSESMLEELPVVKAAARQFAQALLRPADRIAVVGFNQRVFWLTGFTNDYNAAAQSVDRVKPSGETHLYDTAIEMLYELQKEPGRHALVILTDGVDQGSKFKLDHLAYYARYAGIPVYPIIKNKMLSRLLRFGIGRLELRKLETLAHDTGATYSIIQQEKELPAVYAKLAAELRQQYELVFYSQTPQQDQWHPIAVQSKAGQSLRLPRGYFP